jgi:uncharacterized BrkB/YihY/UPF0761 family membrane protein
MGLLAFIVYLILLGLWLAELIDMIKNPKLKTNDKIIWAVFFVVFGIFAAIVYWFIHDRKKSKKRSR